jgi:hypothetical protein
MVRALSLIILTSVALAPIARAGPATKPATEDEEKKQLEFQSAAEAKRLPGLVVQSPADVVHLSVRADMLRAEWLPKGSPPQLRLGLPNPGIVATVTIPRLNGETGTPHGFFMLLRDFSPPGSMSVWTTVSATDGRVQLARDYESSAVSGTTELIQDAPAMAEQMQTEPPVRLTIRRSNEVTGRDEVKLNITATTFVALCRDHPAETQEYLRPIFNDLGSEAAVFAPDPAAVWQALAEDWTPTDSLMDSVKEAIAKFDSDDFQQRRSAAHALHLMGEPAALTLMRMGRSGDRSKFSAAVSAGADTFLAPYLPLSPQEAKRLGNDRDFLLDSQYSSDLELRKLAAVRLAKVTGRPVGFDPAGDEQTRLEAVRRARQEIAGATTKP